MMPRIWTAALLLIGLFGMIGPADAFPWPSRWTNKGKQPAAEPNPSRSVTPNPQAAPLAAWPPRARDLLPEPSLPKLPSVPPGSGSPALPRTPFGGSAASAVPGTNPPFTGASQPGLSASVVLGRPVALGPADPAVSPGTLPAVMPVPQVTTNPVPAPPPPPVPQQYIPPGAANWRTTDLVQQVSFDSPRTTVRGQVEEQDILPVQLSGPPPVPPPPAPGGVGNPLPPLPEGRYNAGVETTQPLVRPSSPFGDFWGSSSSNGNMLDSWGICASDHAFDEGLVSPVTSPFSFEDPRALTELRPVFIYGLIPGSSALGGGTFGYFGVQGRLAFGESFSLVINKLGGVGLDPDETNIYGIDGGTGFAEMNIGPKWTFWRSESWNMVAATGLTFQLPIGSGEAFQNTGTLGLDPYVSFGWNFGRSSYGSFNFLTSVGYSFSVDNTRSQYFHNHYHLSYDIANMHKIYPLIELNWFKYTHQGNDTPYTFEGKDLINFGAANAGFHSYLSLAAGARFKLNEHIQSGIACEWNLTNSQNSLENFRLTIDLIFRY